MKPTNRRRYFTEAELSKLIKAARDGRYGQRDGTLILLMARHGLRVSEAIDLEWDQIDFTKAHLHVRRLKGGIASVHPIQGDELRALRELRRQTEGAFVFASERGGPMTRSNVSKMIEGAGVKAGLPYAHPHMLRHTCGHLLADAGHDTRRLQLWLGHADIKHTTQRASIRIFASLTWPQATAAIYGLVRSAFGGKADIKRTRLNVRDPKRTSQALDRVGWWEQAVKH